MYYLFQKKKKKIKWIRSKNRRYLQAYDSKAFITIYLKILKR